MHPNKLGARVIKDNIYFSLRHPSVVCANPLTHTSGQNMSDHRTSYQLPSHYVVDTSHKDIDNTTQPQQALLMETIPAEPCPQSSSQTNCDVLQQLQDSAPKDDSLENSQGSQDNTSQPLETPEPEPHLTRHIIPLSSISTSKLLTENGGAGVCRDQTLPRFCCKPPDVN